MLSMLGLERTILTWRPASLALQQLKLSLLMFTLWKNEEKYDAEFENKKQQQHKVLAIQDNNLIDQFAS